MRIAIVAPMRRFMAAALAAAALTGTGPTAARAELIAAALSSSYMGSPTLNAERARQRATDEAVPQVLSGGARRSRPMAMPVWHGMIRASPSRRRQYRQASRSR